MDITSDISNALKDGVADGQRTSGKRKGASRWRIGYQSKEVKSDIVQETSDAQTVASRTDALALHHTVLIVGRRWKALKE